MTVVVATRPLWEINTEGKVVINPHQGQARVWQSIARFVWALAGTQGGKALAWDTPIPTPRGFVPIANLAIGDVVFNEQGVQTEVTYCSPVYVGNECYRLTFDDGSDVVADGDHLWVTHTRRQRKSNARNGRNDCCTVTTKEIAESLRGHGGCSNHSIPLCDAPEIADQELPVAPYVLGVWLGDGHSSTAMVTTADADVLDEIRVEGETVGSAVNGKCGMASMYRIGGGTRGGDHGNDTSLQARLRRLGVLNDKHIPNEYLFASPVQRMALLQGLMDTDGTFGHYCEFSSSIERLAKDTAILARSLGIKVRVRSRIPFLPGHQVKRSYRVTFTTNRSVFRLARKAARLPSRVRPDVLRRFIVQCERVPSVPVRCITVAASSGQYLCTDGFIPTHNTSFGPLWLMREMALRGAGDYLAVTATIPLLKMKMLPEFRKLFEYTLCVATYKASEHSLIFRDGITRIIFGSAANPESLESATAKGAYLDEVGQDQFGLQAWEAVQRRLSLYQGRVFGGTTLYNLGWLKQQVYDRWRDGDPDHEVIQFSSTVNPMFPREEFERARRTLPRWKFRMFYEGEYDRPAGMIYEDFVDRYREQGGHKVHPFAIEPEWPRYVGIDFGAVHTTTLWLAQDPETHVFYLYDETMDGNRTSRQHATAALAKSQGVNMQVWTGGAKSEIQYRLDWNETGVPVQEPPIADVEAGIDRVIGLLKAKRLFVFDTCVGTLDEFGTYSRKVDEAGRTTEVIKDKEQFHFLDGLRYGVLGAEYGPALPFGWILAKGA